MPDRADPLRRALAREVEVGADRDRELLEALVTRTDVEVLRGREPVLRDAEAGRAVPENHQALGVRVGQRPQQQGARDGEDGGVRADPIASESTTDVAKPGPRASERSACEVAGEAVMTRARREATRARERQDRLLGEGARSANSASASSWRWTWRRRSASTSEGSRGRGAPASPSRRRRGRCSASRRARRARAVQGVDRVDVLRPVHVALAPGVGLECARPNRTGCRLLPRAQARAASRRGRRVSRRRRGEAERARPTRPRAAAPGSLRDRPPPAAG